jgi:extracellular elastinolytic metalloproteinase
VNKQSFADGVETLVDPEDAQASPLGWHNAGFGNSTTTSYVLSENPD